MNSKKLLKNLTEECKEKLCRELTNKEVELIYWITERQYELNYTQIKTS